MHFAPFTMFSNSKKSSHDISTTWVSFVFTAEQMHRSKYFGANNANCLVCGSFRREARKPCEVSVPKHLDTNVTFGESVTALYLLP